MRRNTQRDCALRAAESVNAYANDPSLGNTPTVREKSRDNRSAHHNDANDNLKEPLINPPLRGATRFSMTQIRASLE